MAERKKVQAKDLQGLKYFDKLQPLLERLHEVGTERDRAGSRKLHYDQYCMLVLLFLFNPIVDSLRGIQQASELAKAQKKLGVGRASLGSLSEATDIFEPERLKEIIQELSQELGPLKDTPEVQEVKHLLTAVDGSLLPTLARVAQAAYLKSPSTGQTKAAWRMHTQFEIARWTVSRLDLTGGNNSGEQGERYVLAQSIESDRCYLIDRGYAKFTLFNDIHRAQSSYVCRLRDNSVWSVVEERPLSEAARQADLVSDQIVRLGEGRPERERPDHPVRVIVIKIEPHKVRGRTGGGKAGPGSDGYLRIATNLLDVPAEVIALLYSYRWTVEIFFRFFKQILGCRHLLSTDPVGVEIQCYCAILACLLISLWTGRKPTKRTYEMICFYLIGWASEDELLAHLRKLERADR
jgi:hypothetical protein